MYNKQVLWTKGMQKLNAMIWSFFTETSFIMRCIYSYREETLKKMFAAVKFTFFVQTPVTFITFEQKIYL